MSTVTLRPLLRPNTLPSLPASSSTSTTFASRIVSSSVISSRTQLGIQPTYICQPCRHARLLRRPKRPYTFTQLVTLSDGSAFTMRTTSPMPVYRSTRDTRNAPLWNPSSKELLSIEDDEAGRLAGFRARFGTSFDAQQQQPSGDTQDGIEGGDEQSNLRKGPFFRQPTETKHVMGGVVSSQEANELDDYHYEFEEDDANLLDLISSYGQEVAAPKVIKETSTPAKKGKK